MKSTYFTALFVITVTGSCLGADRNTAEQLVSALRYGDVVDAMTETCVEIARNTDVLSDLKKTPGLFGDIGPDSPVWEPTKEAYLALLHDNCFFFNKKRATDALTEKYATSLSNAEIEKILAFYKTPAGLKFRDAGIAANNAANTAAVDPTISQSAYERYREKLQDLLRRHHELSPAQEGQGAR
jgi:hypothetical protein